MDVNRRTVLKGTGAAAGASLFATTGAAAAPDIDDALDVDSDDLQGALVVFEPGADYGVLDRFDLPMGTFEMEMLDVVYTKAAGGVLERIAELQQVRYVEANRELEWHNGEAQTATNADDVQERFDLGYTGDGVHVAVIDSGVDAYHPDLQDRLRHNYQFTNPLSNDTSWVDAGVADTDDIGHGTHCAGSVCGEGNRNPDYEGMAPDADLTVYSTGAAVSILQSVAAYNHLLANHAPGTAPSEDEIIRITSNSYGSAGGNDFNPAGAQETATWRAFDAGMVVVSSAGNSGPAPNTLGGAKTAPYILCVAASHDGQGSGADATKRPTEFSSRGRTADYEQGEGARWDEFEANGGYTTEDRDTALDNVRAYHAGGSSRPTVNSYDKSTVVTPGTDAGGIAGAPGAGPSTFVSLKELAGETEFLDIEVSWTTGQQDLDVYLHEGGQDGPVVASSTSGSPGERIRTAADPANSYVLEINPWANVVTQATVSVTEKGEATGADVSGPYGVYRPSVIAPGSAVVSTMGVSALKATEATYGASPADTGALYAALSGTSMSCPVTSGVTAQVIEAYYRNNGGTYPGPEQVIHIMEKAATANAEADYTPFNAGAGLVDAVAAVELAEKGDDPAPANTRLASVSQPEFISATGSRSDDGSAFTGGQTNQVTVTVDTLSHDVSAARETMPDGWSVVATGDDCSTNAAGDTVTFTASEVNAATGDGTAEFTYFVEAPSGPQQTGPYDFGPVEVKSSETADDGFVAVSGTTSTEYVLGPQTNV
ncbi:S8 family serine peptidase [Halorarius halobius]|uniref:S8 family serine peptidase n=1 Tax=Halorarius halobius TaxID=2962671 RepID=UPI0020CE041C|nr:S8 family serine peptidase [Halorarius halobius]